MLFSATSTSLLDDFLIALGHNLQVAQEASGWIIFGLTTASHLLIYGDVLSVRLFWGDAWSQSTAR